MPVYSIQLLNGWVVALYNCKPCTEHCLCTYTAPTSCQPIPTRTMQLLYFTLSNSHNKADALYEPIQPYSNIATRPAYFQPSWTCVNTTRTDKLPLYPRSRVLAALAQFYFMQQSLSLCVASFRRPDISALVSACVRTLPWKTCSCSLTGTVWYR